MVRVKGLLMIEKEKRKREQKKITSRTGGKELGG